MRKIFSKCLGRSSCQNKHLVAVLGYLKDYDSSRCEVLKVLHINVIWYFIFERLIYKFICGLGKYQFPFFIDCYVRIINCSDYVSSFKTTVALYIPICFVLNFHHFNTSKVLTFDLKFKMKLYKKYKHNYTYTLIFCLNY